MEKFNPKVKDFLDKNKDITIIGLYWAGAWRLTTVILIVDLVAVIIDHLK